MKLSFIKFLFLLNQAGNFQIGGGDAGQGVGDAGGDGGQGSSSPDDGGDGGQGGSGNPPSGGNPDDGGGAEYSYPESFPEEYRGNPSVLKFANDKGEFDYGNIMKSYIHLQANQGKDKIVKPNENFTDEQWKETFRAIGVPEDINDFKVENKLPEGVKANEDFFNNFKKTAHEANLLPSQAQKIIDFYNDTVVNNMNTQQESQAEYLKKQESLLQGEWGDAFEKNMGVAEEASKELLSDEEAKELENLGLFKNATFAKLMNKVGQGMLDDTLEPKGNTMGMSPDEIEEEITKIYNSPELQNKTNPGHQAAIDKYNKLMEKRVKYKSRRA